MRHDEHLIKQNYEYSNHLVYRHLKLNGYGYVHVITCATGCIQRGVRYIAKTHNEESLSIDSDCNTNLIFRFD